MRRSGFTLVEILTAAAVTLLVYGLVGAALLQIARLSHQGTAAAEARREVLSVAEELRWRLRCLHRREGGAALRGERGPGPDRDRLLILTAYPGDAVVEAGYRIQEDEQGPYLAYREFPYPDPGGLRPLTDDQEAPWRKRSRRIRGMRLEFSPDGHLWQREWDQPDLPRRVRVTLVLADQGELMIQASPGVGSRRW